MSFIFFDFGYLFVSKCLKVGYMVRKLSGRVIENGMVLIIYVGFTVYFSWDIKVRL